MPPGKSGLPGGMGAPSSGSLKVAAFVPSATFQAMASPCWLPVASSRPSGEKASAPTLAPSVVAGRVSFGAQSLAFQRTVCPSA